jgi:hypothetical protein
MLYFHRTYALERWNQIQQTLLFKFIFKIVWSSMLLISQFNCVSPISKTLSAFMSDLRLLPWSRVNLETETKHFEYIKVIKNAISIHVSLRVYYFVGLVGSSVKFPTNRLNISLQIKITISFHVVPKRYTSSKVKEIPKNTFSEGV